MSLIRAFSSWAGTRTGMIYPWPDEGVATGTGGPKPTWVANQRMSCG